MSRQECTRRKTLSMVPCVPNLTFQQKRRKDTRIRSRCVEKTCLGNGDCYSTIKLSITVQNEEKLSLFLRKFEKGVGVGCSDRPLGWKFIRRWYGRTRWSPMKTSRSHVTVRKAVEGRTHRRIGMSRRRRVDWVSPVGTGQLGNQGSSSNGVYPEVFSTESDDCR